MENDAGFSVFKKDALTNARLGKLTTPHGIVETPSYVIVGTHGRVKCLEPGDLPETKTQLIIANTYHLWRDLGDEGLNSFLGIHQYMGWQGPVMTDSGGFQVFSLGFLRDNGMRQSKAVSGIKYPVSSEKEAAPSEKLVRITESGVYFRENETADEEYLDAELSIKIQEQLGADIIVAFDEPTSPTHDYEYTRAAMNRTHAWARRSLDARDNELIGVNKTKQIMYGVVQGGAFEDLRRESARVIGAMEFDGFAIGGTYGDGYGGTREGTAAMLAWSIQELPTEKPRHLFGVGRIEDLFAGVEAGIDTFDCVIPTREARHGRLWTATGHFDITKGMYATDDGAIDEYCLCPACSTEGKTKQDLHALFKAKDPEAGRLATLHNVFFFNDLMEKIRASIRNEKFSEFKKEFLENLRSASDG